MEKIKRVKVKDFQENEVPLVPYTEDVMGDGHETTVRNFMKLYAREFPEAGEAVEDGVHSFEECWKYITGWARKRAKDSCAALSSDTVFRLAANYYLSPVVEEEKEEPKAVMPVMQPSWDTPEARKAREEAEARRKEEERRKKIEEDVKKNGALLFDFC